MKLRGLSSNTKLYRDRHVCNNMKAKDHCHVIMLCKQSAMAITQNYQEHVRGEVRKTKDVSQDISLEWLLWEMKESKLMMIDLTLARIEVQ